MSSSSSDEADEVFDELVDEVVDNFIDTVIDGQTNKSKRQAYIERDREQLDTFDYATTISVIIQLTHKICLGGGFE